MRNTQPYEQRENEHIYYPTVKNNKIIWALLFILCVAVPVLGVTFASILEIAFLTGVSGFFIFAAIGAVAAFSLARLFAVDIQYISVYRGGLRIYKKDGSEVFYPLDCYAGYTYELVSTRSNYKSAILWFQDGNDRTGLEINCLNDEQKQSIVNDIEALIKTESFKQAAPKKPAVQNNVRPAVIANESKKSDPMQYRLMLEKAAGKITLNDRIHLTKMLTEQRKIDAVKLIQRITGLGIAEARDLAEYHSDLIWVGSRLEQMSKPTGSPYEERLKRKADPAKYKEYLGQAAGHMSYEDRACARELIAQKNNIEAIRLVRVRTGLGLAEVRDLVMDHSEVL